MRRTLLLLTLSCSLLVSCQALKERMEKMGANNAPRTATGKKVVDAAKQAAGEDEGSGSTAGTSNDDTLVAVQIAGEDTGWEFSQTVAGEYQVGSGNKNSGSRPHLIVDPASPTTYAVVDMQGSRWKVGFRGRTWGPYDTVCDWKLAGSFGGYAISPDGERMGFLASRGEDVFYVIDGVEGPAGKARQLGPLIFSGDSASYAYTLGRTGLVVDGKVVLADDGGPRDSIGGVGYAQGTRDLHYYRLSYATDGSRALHHEIVSGDRRFEGRIAGTVEPRFLADGTPLWYEQPADGGQGLLMLGGEPVPGAGLLGNPNTSSLARECSPDLLANILGDGGDGPLAGFFVVKDGRAAAFDIPEALRSDARSIAVNQLLVAPDLSSIAYPLRDRVVMNGRASLGYERILGLGFTGGGHCVAAALQGGRVFLIVDGVEQEQGYELGASAELFTSTADNRVTLFAGGRIFSGAVGRDGLALAEQDLDGWQVSRLHPSDDGSALLSMARRYDQGNTSLAVMRDFERFDVPNVVAVRSYDASPDGSMVLWEGRVTTAQRAREAVLFGDQLLGRVMDFRDTSFGDGHYAFTALRHPAVGQSTRDAANLPPLLCIDGTFFDGLRVLQPGTWVGDTFHVLCARGEGDDAEVFMAAYES